MWCSSSSSTCSLRPEPRTDAPAAAARRPGRTPCACRVRQSARPGSASRRLPSTAQRRPRRRRVENPLARLAVARRGRRCAAPRAAPPASPSARRQRRRVQRAGQPQRQRDVVGRARPLQLVEEPQPLLRERQRQLAPDAHRRPAPARGRLRLPSSARGQRRRRSAPRTARGAASSTPSAGADPAISRVASSECPPSSKKLSSTPTRSQRPAPRRTAPHSTSSARRARRRVRARAGVAVRRGQRPAVELAVRRSAAARPAPRTRTAPCSPAALAARCARSAAASGARTVARPPRRRPAACRPALSSRATTAACAHRRDARASAASISPSSMRKPRIFTCVVGAAQELQRRRRRASAPGRRCGTAGCPARPNGSATNRSAVSSGAAQIAARQPGARDVQLARDARPAPAAGRRRARRPACSQIGRPIGTASSTSARHWSPGNRR